MDQCVFCSIARGAVEASVVYEGEGVLAFLDIHPVFHGHTLVIPVEHHETLPDLPHDQLERFFGAVQRLASAVREGMQAHGTFIAMNNVVSQSVPHLHAHVVPRRRKDGLRGFFWPRMSYPDDAAREDVRAAIAAAVQDVSA